jgi:hypothetical protein
MSTTAGGDLTGNGRPDLFFTGNAVHNRLYLNRGDLQFEDVTRANRLYINQGVGDDGVPTVEERAAAYGIADSSYSTHAAFFDYNRDGRLDLYVLNTATQRRGQVAIDAKQTEGQPKTTDRLYRNDGDGTFTDVSEEAGIQIEGHGLGLAINDVNKDGWPDAPPSC